MKTPTELFFDWLDLFLIGKESLTPAQVETLKAKVKALKGSGAQIQNLTESKFDRPKPESYLEFQPITFNKDE